MEAIKKSLTKERLQKMLEKAINVDVLPLDINQTL